MKKSPVRIVVCAQESELFAQCVEWLKLFFIDFHAKDREYEFCFVSVIPQDKADICGVMAQGLGVPASLAQCDGSTCGRSPKRGPDPTIMHEKHVIGKIAAGLLTGESNVYILRHGHGDSVDAETVGKAVCEFCKHMDADMVVVSQYRSTPGRRDEDLRHIYHGSVVKYLLQHCPRPVLIYTN